MTASVEVLPDHLSVSFASDDPADHLDIERALRDLKELRDIRTALGDWEHLLTEWVADYLGRNTIDLEGIGHVEVKHGTDRKEWDRRELLRAVLDSRQTPSEDGEANPCDDGFALVGGEELSCSPDLSRVLDCWNLGAPRVTALRERGIDPGEFCTSIPGKVTVVLS